MGALRWPDKDPDDVFDYQHIWSDWLGADTMASNPVATVQKGDVIIDSDSYSSSTGVQTIWLSGGTSGTDCQIILHAITTSGREKDEGIAISIRAK